MLSLVLFRACGPKLLRVDAVLNQSFARHRLQKVTTRIQQSNGNRQLSNSRNFSEAVLEEGALLSGDSSSLGSKPEASFLGADLLTSPRSPRLLKPR